MCASSDTNTNQPTNLYVMEAWVSPENAIVSIVIVQRNGILQNSTKWQNLIQTSLKNVTMNCRTIDEQQKFLISWIQKQIGGLLSNWW